MQGNEYGLIEVKIGTCGPTADYRRIYRFTGRQIAFIRNYDGARSKDDRGTDKTLYQINQDKYLVLIEEWSRWEGESNYYRFYCEDLELEPNAPTVISGQKVAERFPDLANDAGLEFPIDLDDVMLGTTHTAKLAKG